MTVKSIHTWVLLLCTTSLLGVIGCSPIERKLLFHPTHRAHDNRLAPWTHNGEIIGYARKVDAPRNVWLMMHGNAGQASGRIYALSRFSNEDSIYILEYPGYGKRKGVPSKASFNQAAREAYLLLRETYPHIPVCVVGESIGSGPASFLATLAHPPDKIVLLVPFDELAAAAKDHFPAILVYLILSDNWNNGAALAGYKGPVEIFGAQADDIIPLKHARTLAAAVPGSKLIILTGGHNDWAGDPRAKIRN